MRVVIGEDSALFREGLAHLPADAGHEVVAKAQNASELVSAVMATRPGLASSTSGCRPTSPTTAARRIRDTHSELGIVLLSQHVEPRHSVDLVSRGRFGYLLKDWVFDVDDFLDALRRVAAAGSALGPETVPRLIGARLAADPLASLTTREGGVLALMAEGRTNVGIAWRLWLTHRTVETHVSSILTKPGPANSAEDQRRVPAVLLYLNRA